MILATPPRKDGSVSPEVLYIAARCGVKTILLAGMELHVVCYKSLFCVVVGLHSLLSVCLSSSLLCEYSCVCLV